MLFLLASGIIIFMVLYQRRMLEHRMSIQAAETKHQQELFYGTLEAIEGERKRLARDLHDEVGASLSVMRLLVNEVATFAEKPSELEKSSSKYKTIIDNTIDNVRRISNDLLPQGLEEFGLEYAVEGLCEKIMDVSDIEVRLSRKDVKNINNTISLAVYRLLQELLNNAVKHSEASLIEINIRKHNSDLLLSYSDNGKGFNFNEAYQKRSLGLKNIETRTKVLNGTAKFETRPNAGLKVEIQIPLSQ